MNQLPPETADLSPLVATRIAEVALAADRAELAARADAALRAALPGHRAAVIWLGDADAPVPDEALLTALRGGAPATDPDSGAGCFPLRAGGELLGWIALEPAGWSAEQEPWLGLLAAVLAPAARALHPPPPPPLELRRAALREAIATLRRPLTPEDLLHELSALIRAHFAFQSIYWVLRYRASEWAHIGYGSLGERADWPRIFWKHGAGLSGAVLGGAALYTEDYAAECARRGITPIYDERLGRAYAWFAVPLRDSERVFGALVTFGNTPDAALSAEDRALLEWFAGETAHAVLGAQRYAQAAEQARQRDTLNLIARQINRSLDPDDVPALIVERAPELLNAEEASLLLLDDATGELVFRYAAGPAGHSLLGRRLPAGEGVAGFVASSGESSIVNDTSADGRFYGDVDDDSGFTTRSIVAVPLRGLDGVRGVIEVLNHRDNAPFTDEDRELLEALADQAVTALENARRFASKERALARRAQELDRSNDRLVKILRASNALRAERPLADILHEIAQVVVDSSGFRSALIALARRGRAAEPTLQPMACAGEAPPPPATRIPLGELEPLLRPEFRRGSLAYLVEGRPAPYRALWGQQPAPAPARPGTWRADDALIVLLRDSHGEISGLIALDGPEDGNRPSAEQVQILEILANQAAAAIENAHLYADQQHSLSRMMALNGLGRAISTTLRSPQQIYELTASGMLEMSGASWAAVYLGATADALRPALHIGAPAAAPAPGIAAARDALSLRRPLSRLPGPGAEGMLAVPLLGSSRSLGAICVGYGAGLPDTGDIESLVLFASQAASAVESLLLLGEVRLGRDQLASIMASTREGMLLVGDDGRVDVANAAFLHLADAAGWFAAPNAPADLADMPLRELLWQWQASASFPPGELELLRSGIAAVGDGAESFLSGQLNGTAPGSRALEWSVLRATREGDAGTERPGEQPQRRWPILVTVRDITAAKEAERLRNDLTNMMVHDLRSPLSSIVSSIDLIFRGVTGPSTPQQRDVLTIAYGSTQKLLDMINLLLDISRLEGGRMPLEPAPLRPADLAASAFESQRVVAGAKGVTLRSGCDDAPAIHADRELVLRVLQNLLDNALKFSPKDGTVTLSAAPDIDAPGFVRFAVCDCGIGIRAQDLELIFAKFGQAGNRRGSGTGLGLTFCKLVVEAHGGRIWVESEVGHGSTFFFTLPAAGERAETPTG
jgi:signal transduction histidine kinase